LLHRELRGPYNGQLITRVTDLEINLHRPRPDGSLGRWGQILGADAVDLDIRRSTSMGADMRRNSGDQIDEDTSNYGSD
jgi:hypothetical protein